LKKSVSLWVSAGFFIILVYGLLDPELYAFPKCPLRSMTGLLCPGCGSQRAIHQLLHGQFISSFQLNALFIPAILYGLTGYLTALFSPKLYASLRPTWFGTKAAYVWLGIILVFWVGRNVL
jgi:hypothetical protein